MLVKLSSKRAGILSGTALSFGSRQPDGTPSPFANSSEKSSRSPSGVRIMLPHAPGMGSLSLFGGSLSELGDGVGSFTGILSEPTSWCLAGRADSWLLAGMADSWLHAGIAAPASPLGGGRRGTFSGILNALVSWLLAGRADSWLLAGIADSCLHAGIAAPVSTMHWSDPCVSIVGLEGGTVTGILSVARSWFLAGRQILSLVARRLHSCELRFLS